MACIWVYGLGRGFVFHHNLFMSCPSFLLTKKCMLCFVMSIGTSWANSYWTEDHVSITGPLTQIVRFMPLFSWDSPVHAHVVAATHRFILELWFFTRKMCLWILVIPVPLRFASRTLIGFGCALLVCTVETIEQSARPPHSCSSAPATQSCSFASTLISS